MAVRRMRNLSERLPSDPGERPAFPGAHRVPAQCPALRLPHRLAARWAPMPDGRGQGKRTLHPRRQGTTFPWSRRPLVLCSQPWASGTSGQGPQTRDQVCAGCGVDGDAASLPSSADGSGHSLWPSLSSVLWGTGLHSPSPRSPDFPSHAEGRLQHEGDCDGYFRGAGSWGSGRPGWHPLPQDRRRAHSDSRSELVGAVPPRSEGRPRPRDPGGLGGLGVSPRDQDTVTT